MGLKAIYKSTLGAFLAGVSLAATPSAASAQPTTLVVQIYARPADRPALRNAFEREQSPALGAWHAKGLLSHYQLYFSRYPDSGVWDAMEVLTFPDARAETAWREVERNRPAGLAPQTLALVQSIETTPSMEVRAGGGSGPSPTTLVIPYVARIPPADYLRYLDGYTVPQFGGWMSAHVLDGYRVLTSRFPADRQWNALILLDYHDDAALARRAEVVTSTRARLALDPAWKAISDNKKAVRTEKLLAVADRIASDGDAR